MQLGVSPACSSQLLAFALPSSCTAYIACMHCKLIDTEYIRVYLTCILYIYVLPGNIYGFSR